jgi:hypothetical protein
MIRYDEKSLLVAIMFYVGSGGYAPLKLVFMVVDLAAYYLFGLSTFGEKPWLYYIPK